MDAAVGGILSLLEAYEEDEEFQRALDLRLLELGLRMRWLGDGTDRLLCVDLLAVVHGMREWDAHTHMLANILDTVRIIIWQLGGDGKPPKPIERPGQPRAATGEAAGGSSLPAPAVEGNPFNADESGVFRGVSMPMSEMREWLGWVTRDDLIYEAYSGGGRTYADVAAEFDVSASTVGRIVRKRRD